jgi:parallel beta-helix repeat protein
MIMGGRESSASQHCRNITIERNEVYRNGAAGISFSIGMQNSIAKDNNVHDEGEGHIGISVSESSNNKIYQNRIASATIGIKLTRNSSNNYVYNNTFNNIEDYDIFVREPNTVNNTFEGNDRNNSISSVRVRIYNNTGSLFTSADKVDINSGNTYFIEGNSALRMNRSTFPLGIDIISDNSSNNLMISNS